LSVSFRPAFSGLPIPGGARGGDGAPARAKVPADVDAPDRVAFDLTVRQITILAVAGLACLMLWTMLARAAPLVPVAVRGLVLVPIAGTALALAVGRRDGLPLDGWLLAGAVFRTRVHRLAPGPGLDPPPWWANRADRPGMARAAGRAVPPPPGALRLPVDGIDPDGTLRHARGPRPGHPSGDRGPGGATVLVSSGTVNISLRTPAEQAALVAGLGRWLNGLTSPVQVVVSSRRVDLPGHALRLAAHARRLAGGPGNDGSDERWADRQPTGEQRLADAALDHAQFLLDLAEDGDPLARTVTIAVTAPPGTAPALAARRAAEHTVTHLTALGAQAVILDAGTATAVLTAATDPYQAGDAAWPRTPPGGVVTARPLPQNPRQEPRQNAPHDVRHDPRGSSHGGQRQDLRRRPQPGAHPRRQPGARS